MSTSIRTKPTSAVCQEADRAEHRHTARLDWLRERPTLLARLPDVVGEPTPDQETALDAAVREMCFWQLFPPGLQTTHVRAHIRLLVHELRA